MPKLPSCGWFHYCECCGVITSRITELKYKRRSKSISICSGCRTEFVLQLLDDFKTVIITEELVGTQYVRVTK